MYSQLRPAVVALILLSVLTGVIYPLAVTGIARLAFAAQADGSIVTLQGRPVGSNLIGQSFDDPRYFWARPSATVPSYDASAGSGSNLASTNPALIKAVRDRIDRLRAVDPADRRPIPIDLVTASASGLDPHITPAAAEYQVARVSRARNLDEAIVRRLAAAHTQERQFGLLGEPCVNVLQLNLALDRFIAADAAGYNGRTQ